MQAMFKSEWNPQVSPHSDGEDQQEKFLKNLPLRCWRNGGSTLSPQ
jgi:hypothetical protein